MDYSVVYEIDPNWSGYDKSVAQGMLYDFGEIYVDSYGMPIDDEYWVEDIRSERTARKGKKAMGEFPKSWADEDAVRRVINYIRQNDLAPLDYPSEYDSVFDYAVRLLSDYGISDDDADWWVDDVTDEAMFQIEHWGAARKAMTKRAYTISDIIEEVEYYTGEQISQDDAQEILWMLEDTGADIGQLLSDLGAIASRRTASDYPERIIYTDFDDPAAFAVLDGVSGQLSDGIWENSSAMDGYWRFFTIDRSCNIVVDGAPGEYDRWARGHYVSNKLYNKSDDEVKKWLAGKVKAVAKEWLNDHGGCGLGWKRENDQDAVSYFNGIGGSWDDYPTVQDAYRVYDSLLGRQQRIFRRAMRKRAYGGKSF